MVSRRGFVAGGVCGCLCCAAGQSLAKVLSTTLQPLVSQDYAPVDADERGMWQEWRELEDEMSQSELLLRAPDLQEYTVAVIDRLLGRPATDLRVYIVRDARFNASMTPTGMMLVHTGLLARLTDEAQFATVLGHEAGHYFRKHSIERYRDIRTKSAIGAFIAAGANAAAGYYAMQGYDGRSWIDLANSINQALVLSVLRFSREQESEADAYGIGLMANSGYRTSAAAEVWRQIIEERMASADERDKKYRDGALSAYSTHPPSGERMVDLAETADRLAASRGDVPEFAGAEQWHRVIGPFLPALIEEQVKLNDPGASMHLLETHARFGWNGVLRYYEGEIYRLRGAAGDLPLAAAAYAAAVAYPDAPPEAWRAHGYALLKLGRREDGTQALLRYLEVRPDAKDAAMVRFTIGQ